MALDELNDQLHSRGFHTDRVRKSTMFEPKGMVSDTFSSELSRTENWQDQSAKSVMGDGESLTGVSPRKKYWRALAFGIGGIVVVSAVLIIAMKINASRFSEDNIEVTLTGANDVSSAEQVTFVFEYTNDNWASLENATIVFEYPESFHPDLGSDFIVNQSRAEKKLGEITSHSQGRVTLSGKFFGFRGERGILSGILRYNPSTSSGVFEKRVQKEVRVATSPIFFEMIAPTELASGQEIQYEIRYGNNGETDIPNLRIRLDYPLGFTFTDAEPKPADGDAVWSVGTLAPHVKGTIVVRGRLTGERDQQKLVHGAIGFFQGDGKFSMYSEHEKKTRMVASPLVIALSVNKSEHVGSVDAGDALEYAIRYKNEGNVGIRDAILTVEIDSPYIDWSTLQFAGNIRGAYNQSNKAVLWKASDMKTLARIEPGQGGEVFFTVHTYKDLKSRFPDARELTYQSVAKIDSPDIPALNGVTKVVASSAFIVKLNTLVTDEVRVSYQDGTFQDSGPLPPVIGQETTYTVRYTLTNTWSAVEDGRVSIVFPTGIRYTGNKSPEGEKMVFNERSNELILDVGTLNAWATRSFAFQVGATADPASLGKEILLISRATFTGKDTFTGQEVRLEKEKKTNAL